MTAEHTQLFVADVDALKDAAAFAATYAAASPERKAKVDRMRFDEDKQLSLGAETLLRKALVEIGIDLSACQIEINEHGKPFLKGKDLYFNLSHSGHYVLCALSDLEVGCDIEKSGEWRVKSGDEEVKLAQRFFTQREYKTIAAQPTAEAQRHLFYRYWTLKESVIKATGEGLHLPLNAFEITIDKQIQIRWLDHKTNDYPNLYLKEFFDIPGYCCAVCRFGKPEKIGLKTIEL